MKALIALFCLMLLGSAQAQNFYQDDVNSMLFIKKDFGGSSSNYDKSLKFGFAVNHSQVHVGRMGRLNLISPNTIHRPLVNIEYSTQTRYFSKFNLGGVDALTYRTVLNQNGEATRWPMGLSTTQMVIGGAVVAVGGYFLVAEVIADGNDTDDID
jgi:hypothetical protein